MDGSSLAPVLALALGAPLAGAALLLVPTVATRLRVTGGIAIAAVGISALGLIGMLSGWPVLGPGGRYVLSLGPLDPSGTIAATVWDVAPALLGVLFVVIAARRRHVPMAAFALVGLVLALAAATVSWRGAGAEPAGATGAGGTAGGAGGGALVLDPLAAALLVVTVGVGGLIVVYAVGYEPGHLRHRGLPARRTGPFIAWLLVFLASMQVLVLADDLRLLVTGWELATLCCFALIRFDDDEPARAAADRALVYNLGGGAALAASVLLAGPGAHITTILQAAAGGPGPGIALLPIVLAGAVAAAAVKSALVPFHPWLLGAMVAAAPVSALLHASTMVNAGSYLLFRLSPAIAADALLGPVVALMGGLAFAWTALLALRERDLKRILALSTISTLGLIAVAAGLGSPAAFAAGTTLLLFHAAAKALAFLAVGTIEQASATRDLEELAGLARRRPLLAAPLLVSMAALTLPPFGVAVAKWALLELGVRDLLLTVVLAAGATASVALWTTVGARLLVRRADRRPGSSPVPVPPASKAAMAGLSVVAVGGLVLAGPIVDLLAEPAAAVAFGARPDLAAAWSILLPGGAFAVPTVAALLLAASALGVLVAIRTRPAAPAPYLSGATMASPDRARAVFHGPRGDAVEAGSGGFYWGAAGSTGTMPAGAPPAAGRWLAAGRWPAADRWSVAALAGVTGWLVMVLLAASAVVSTLAAVARTSP